MKTIVKRNRCLTFKPYLPKPKVIKRVVVEKEIPVIVEKQVETSVTDEDILTKKRTTKSTVKREETVVEENNEIKTL